MVTVLLDEILGGGYYRKGETALRRMGLVPTLFDIRNVVRRTAADSQVDFSLLDLRPPPHADTALADVPAVSRGLLTTRAPFCA